MNVDKVSCDSSKLQTISTHRYMHLNGGNLFAACQKSEFWIDNFILWVTLILLQYGLY